MLFLVTCKGTLKKRWNVVNAKGLLKYFTTVEKLVKASKEKLIECDGIGGKRAEFLFEFFRREYKK